MWSEDAVWRPQAACVPLSCPLTAESRPDQGFGTRDPLTLCAHPTCPARLGCWPLEARPDVLCPAAQGGSSCGCSQGPRGVLEAVSKAGEGV